MVNSDIHEFPLFNSLYIPYGAANPSASDRKSCAFTCVSFSFSFFVCSLPLLNKGRSTYSFSITVNPKTSNQVSIQCSSIEICIQQLLTNSQTVVSKTGNINTRILGNLINGVENKKIFQDFPTKNFYTQTDDYFIFPINMRVFLINSFSQTYSSDELANMTNTFSRIFSTFKIDSQ